jgi:hypothetical protein
MNNGFSIFAAQPMMPKYCNKVTNKEIGIIKLNNHKMVLVAEGKTERIISFN